MFDSSKAENHPAARLDSFIREVDREGNLVVSDAILVGDRENAGSFTFRFDIEAGEFAAGSAFLKK